MREESAQRPGSLKKQGFLNVNKSARHRYISSPFGVFNIAFIEERSPSWITGRGRQAQGNFGVKLVG